MFSENVILSGRDDWLKEDAPFSLRNQRQVEPSAFYYYYYYTENVIYIFLYYVFKIGHGYKGNVNFLLITYMWITQSPKIYKKLFFHFPRSQIKKNKAIVITNGYIT